MYKSFKNISQDDFLQNKRPKKESVGGFFNFVKGSYANVVVASKKMINKVKKIDVKKNLSNLKKDITKGIDEGLNSAKIISNEITQATKEKYTNIKKDINHMFNKEDVN